MYIYIYMCVCVCVCASSSPPNYGNTIDIIGMGAILMDGAVIGDDSLVAAGALVTEGKVFPPKSMIVGSPAKLRRHLTAEEVESVRRSADKYVKVAQDHLLMLRMNAQTLNNATTSDCKSTSSSSTTAQPQQQKS